jgi:uncharacterized cupin superfamily protein
VGLAHLDELAPARAAVAHLRGLWTDLGTAAGSVTVGLNRIQVADGHWSTPVHEHGREEEIFFVLSGHGVWWQDERVAPIRAGDCIACPPGTGAHSLHGLDGLDVLAFGTRCEDEAPRFPRLELSRVGNRAVKTESGEEQGIPVQWLREAKLGPPELPSLDGPRPPSIVNVAALEGTLVERPRVARRRRNLGAAAGSVRTGLQHVEVLAEREAAPPHCHSVEEELFVVLSGEGVLELGEEELPVRAGSVIARPAGTGVAHCLRAGASGLTFLAYGTRDPADVCYYPRSNKISFRGVKVISRVERLDYWDGED